MAVMARDAWTDERLDDLNHRVDSGFGEVGREFQAVRLEMRTEFAAVRGEINGLRGEMRGMREEMAGIRAEMAADRRATLQLAGGMLAAYVIGFLGVIATVLTQV